MYQSDMMQVSGNHWSPLTHKLAIGIMHRLEHSHGTIKSRSLMDSLWWQFNKNLLKDFHSPKADL